MRQSAVDKKGTFIFRDNPRQPAEKEIDDPTKQLFHSFMFFNQQVWQFLQELESE